MANGDLSGRDRRGRRGGGGEEGQWMATCAVKPKEEEEEGTGSKEEDEEQTWDTHRPSGPQVLKPEPVHGAAHSVVVG